jgi:NAD-dependent dihydropyrimidine dehydrogenase PreA subunit
MPYVIGEPCIDVMDKSCLDECPVDCIYEGARKLYIHPTECIDCGACEPVCPVEAISPEVDVDPEGEIFIASEAEFFEKPLPGRSEPLGAPGGAASLGTVNADSELVASYADRS